MKNHLYTLFYIFIWLFMGKVMAFVPSLTSQLKPLYWSEQNSAISLYYNPTNTSNLSEGFVSSVFVSAVGEWANVSGTRLSFVLQKSTNIEENKNEIYFSNDQSIFGSGVIGIALVSYKDSTGEILEADIALNDDIVFSSDQDNSLYLGNVITHELGHFLGLGHEPNLESTMFYQAERGQFKLAEFDKQSILQLYLKDSDRGAIAGKIVGGNSLVGIFGAQVMALDVDGKIAATQISDPDGKFNFKGLTKDKIVYIYTKPLAFKSSLPAIYSAARVNFCTNGESYRGSFFQTCMRSDEGFPASVLVSANTTKSIGNISIRCGFDVPQNYFSAKDSGDPYELDFNKFLMSTAFTGYFTERDVANTKEDVIEFKIPTDAVDVGEDDQFNVRINFRSQIFYSIYKADLSIYKNDVKIYGRTDSTSDLVVESDFSLNLDKDIVVTGVMGDRFQIRIKPKNWFNYLQLEENISPIRTVGRRLYSTKDFFPGFLISSFDSESLGIGEASNYKSSMSLKDNLNLYFLSIETTNLNNERLGSRFFIETDNSQCPDAPNAYVVKNPLTLGQSETAKSKNGKIESEFPIACGSIVNNTDGGGPSGGLGQVLAAFVLIFLLSRIQKKLVSRIKIKKLASNI